MNFRTLKNRLLECIYTAVMMLYVPWLNEAKSRCTVIVKNFQIHQYFVCHLPAIRPGSTTCTGPIFLTKNVIGGYHCSEKDLYTAP